MSQPTSLPTPDEFTSLLNRLLREYESFCSGGEQCRVHAEVADMWARLRPAWPRLTNEAHDAISVEHERDHSDEPNLPREGCLGCRMIAEIDALHADLARLERQVNASVTKETYAAMQESQRQLREDLAACVAALTEIMHRASGWDVGHVEVGEIIGAMLEIRDRAALARVATP